MTSRAAPVRIAVYTDYSYTRNGDILYAERAFALFLAALAERVERMVIVGRLRPDGGESRYPLPAGVDFIALPFYESLAQPRSVIGSMFRSLRRFWRGLDEVDVCWLLGPHPLALAFAALARIRGRRVILGVRQDLIAYARSRHPDRRGFELVALALEKAYRGLARIYPVVVVGPELRRQYAASPRLLEIAVSLVPAAEVATSASDDERSYSGDLRILSVGRIDAEKNPLMLADVLAQLRADQEPGWELTVCGEGPLEEALRARTEELDIAEHVAMRGYVQHGAPMRQAYRDSHVLLHVSWTEGLPQVIVEALAARLPVVATDVGGIGEAVGSAALLIAPGDPDAAVAALRRVAADAQLRQELTAAGTAYAQDHTLQAEIDRLASFIADPEVTGRTE